MKTRLVSLLGIGSALVLVVGLVGCGGSTAKSARKPATIALNAQLVSSRHAVGDLLDACRRGDMHAVQQHSASNLRGQPWNTVCRAMRDHHMKLVSDKVDVHGNSMTALVVLRSSDNHPRNFDDTWRFEYHNGEGWELTHMPAMMLGGWDHDQHMWGTAPTNKTPVQSSTTIARTSTTSRHDDQHPDNHQGSTPMTVHHDGADHQGSTPPTVHHDGPDHQGSTPTTVHHDGPDHQGSTPTTVHHDGTDHGPTGMMNGHDGNR